MKDADSDFNPGFRFDAAGFESQPAWEFSGALAEARKEQANNKHATTIDHKIHKRLETKRGRAETASKV